MSGLYSALSMATRSLAAQQFGLELVGHNIANVNTEGYTRRTVDLVAVAPTSVIDAGGGVDVQGVRTIRDTLIESRLWRELPDQQKQAAIADALGLAEVALGDAGESIDAQLTEFFDAFARLADDPTSPTARQQVLGQGEAVSSAFSDMVSHLTVAQRDADTRIRGTLDQINALATEIATLNATIGGAGVSGVGVETLKDRQVEAVKTLSGLIDVNVIYRDDGGLDLTFGLGRPLVIGENGFTIDAAATPPRGLSSLISNGVSLGSEITSGALGGLLQVRDTALPGYITRLDDIAYALSTQVNSLTTAGYDLDGTAGLAFFTPLGSSTGAASALAVNAAVAADPSKVVAAGVPAAGDNTVARDVADLRDRQVMFGNTATLTEAWGRLVYQAGLDTHVAKSDATVRADIVRQIQALRDSVSGVSLDEEASNMLKFQRAYEANARFFVTVNSALDTLLNLVGQ
jgi:flagellar hook-associated protein 1 FlgK